MNQFFIINTLYILFTFTFAYACCSGTDENVGVSIFEDFKAVMMYFSESFLKGSKFGDESLEGEMKLTMPKRLLEALEILETDAKNKKIAKSLKKF